MFIYFPIRIKMFVNVSSVVFISTIFNEYKYYNSNNLFIVGLQVISSRLLMEMMGPREQYNMIHILIITSLFMSNF